MQRSVDSFFRPKGKTPATDEDDSLGLPPLAPVPVGTRAPSSSCMGEDPSLLDAMAMEETINADAVAMTVSTAGTSEQAGASTSQENEGGDSEEPEPPARRFWNQRLKPLYDSCFLPVKSTPSEPHHRSENDYSFDSTSRHGNENWTFSPAHPPPVATPPLSERMRPLVHPPPPPPPPEPSRKRAKKNDGSASSSKDKDTPTEKTEEEEKKKAVPFKRKVVLEGQLRTYKVRMWPTSEQKRALKLTFAGARRAYNWTLEQIKEHDHRINAIALRTKFRAEYEPPDWLKNDVGGHAVNSDILAAACKQVVDAYSSNFAKQKKDPSHSFEIKYRGRRNYTEVVKIAKDSPLKKTSQLLKFAPVPYANSDGRAECLAFFGCSLKDVGGIRLQDKAFVVERMLAEGNRLKEDAKIKWDRRTDAYYFVYTFEQPKLPDPDPEFKGKRVVTLDSGVTPFNAFYSPTSGEYGQLLHDFRGRLEPRILKLDALQSRVDGRYSTRFDPVTKKIAEKKIKPSPTGRTKRQYRRTTRRLEKRLARERRRHYGWTEAAHYDAANFLLGKHDLVVNPKLKTQRLSMRSGRTLRTKTARSMLTMSHYMFDQRLKWASSRYEGRHVVDDTGEPGTSKTCGNCGKWKPNLALGDKVFQCDLCGVHIDRDTANGARNNFFAALGKAMGVGPDLTST